MLAVKAGTLDQGLPTPNSIPGSEQPDIINNLHNAVDRNKPVNFPELQRRASRETVRFRLGPGSSS